MPGSNITSKKLSLNTIFQPIQSTLNNFEKDFRILLYSDVGLIEKITEFILELKGKKIRPALVLTCANMVGTPNSFTNRVAGLIEILHIATLAHDDVIDEADSRRGRESINFRWNNKTAVLYGDFLFTRILSEMIKLESPEAMEVLIKTTELLSTGEIMQIEKSVSQGITEQIYFDMIWAKTASLFAASCKIGGISVDASSEDIEKLYQFGKYLGIAYQIKDDLLDINGNFHDTGKPVGMDIRHNIITLPVINMLKSVQNNDKQKFLSMLEGEVTNANVEDILRMVKETESIEYTEEKIRKVSEKALSFLYDLPNSEYKRSLKQITDFNQTRLA